MAAESGVPVIRFQFVRVIEFVEVAVVAIEYEDVAISVAGFGIAFDRGVRRDWHRSRITLAAVSGEADFHQRRGALDDVWDADGLPSVESGAEIRMERRGRADEADVILGVGIDRRGGDVFIPETGRRKGHESVEARADAR